MRRYILSHVPMGLLYAAIVAVLRVGWSWDLTILWRELWWVGGVVVGVLLVYLDRIAYIYSFPEEQLSQQALWYFNNKKIWSALTLLDSRRHEQVKLTFRSALFMVAWIPLAFFAITSTSALFGKGIVLGLLLHILLDSWRLQKEAPRMLNVRLFWQIKREVSREEQLVFLWAMTILFVFFSLWVR